MLDMNDNLEVDSPIIRKILSYRFLCIHSIVPKTITRNLEFFNDARFSKFREDFRLS